MDQTRTEPGSRTKRRRLLATPVAVGLLAALLLGACTPLTDLKPVERADGWASQGVTMNAKDYSQAWVYPGPSYYTCGTAAAQGYLEFNLGRSYKTFDTTVGSTDTTNSSVRFDYRILVDGVQKASGTAQLGSTKPISVTVKGALRLRLEVHRRCGYSGNRGAFAYATPILGK